MPSVAEELWLDFYEDTKEHVVTLYHLLEEATDKYVISGLSHGINICKYRVLKMYCDELLEEEDLLFIEHIESIAPEVIIEVPLSCRRHIGCSCQKKRDDERYEAALRRLTRTFSGEEVDELRQVQNEPSASTTTICPPDSFRDDEPQLLTEYQSTIAIEHDGVISEDTVSKSNESRPAEFQDKILEGFTPNFAEGHAGMRFEGFLDKGPPHYNVVGHSRDWHSLIERLRKAKTIGDVQYEDYIRYVGLALADGRVDTNAIRKLPRHERFKGGDPSEWEKTTRAQVSIPTLAEILKLFI